MSLMRGNIYVYGVNDDESVNLTEVLVQDEGTLKIYMSVYHESFEEQERIRKIWDTVPIKLKKTKKVVASENANVNNVAEQIHGDYWRRIDIGSTAKFATNIPNVTYAAKIATAIRYLKNYSKCVNVQTGAVLTANDAVVSDVRRYALVNDMCNTYGVQGTYYTKNGMMIALQMQTPYVTIQLQQYDPEEYPYSCFGACKYVEVKGGTSKTKIKQVAAPFTKELLGFDFEESVAQAVEGDVFLLYNDMEEVIAAHPDKDYRWVRNRKYEIATPENFESILKEYYAYDGIIAIDTETTGLNINYLSRQGLGAQLTGICMSMRPGEGHYFPLQMHNMENLCGGDHQYFMARYMRKFLTTHKFVTHNLHFDWKVFYIYEIDLNVVFDTMVAFAVTEKLKNATFEIGLKALSHNLLNIDQLSLSDFVKNGDWSKSGMSFADLPFELCRCYAPADADMTISLYNYIKQTKLLESYGAEYIAALETQFGKVVAYSEFWGYHVNVDAIPKMQQETTDEMTEIYNKMVKLVGHDFNPASSQQLCKIFDDMGLPLPDSGKRSTSKDVLKELAEMTDCNDQPLYPIAAYLHKYRQLQGIISNFLKRKDEFLSVDDTIFPTVRALGARTGRCSVTEPNYQSYNDVVKKNITPRPGFKMWDSDFSQIEYRTLSSMAHEQMLIDAFADPDMDYHTLQASRMFKVPYASVTGDIRQQAKRINFALPYGMGDESLGANIFGKRCKENTIRAAELRDLYFEGQDNIRNFFDVVRADGVKNGYTTTLFGRKRFYPKGSASVSKIRRQAGNAVIQGCLHGDTYIQTKELGIVKIKDAANNRLHVWDGNAWTVGDVLYSGKKQKCIVHFTNGMTMITSPIHKFLVCSNGKKNFVACQDLVGTKYSKSPSRVVVNPHYVPSNCNLEGITHINFDDSTVTVFNDTQKLRKYIMGMWNSNGDYNTDLNSCILTFIGAYAQDVSADVQKALLFFGVRSKFKQQKVSSNSAVVYNLTINKNDIRKFYTLIDDEVNDKELLRYLLQQTNTANCITVRDVEITDEYIDMFDVCNTERGYYVADGVVTHNTAADIYKIACVRVFDMIRSKGWLGKVLMCGFIHDEILGEVSDEINFGEFIACWKGAFEVPIEGFCKLYAGFGIGNSWYQAKKQDLHPLFIQELVDNKPTVWDPHNDADKYINDTVINGFKKHKVRRVANYLVSKEAQGNVIKPIIGSYLTEAVQDYMARMLQQDKEKLIQEITEAIGHTPTENEILAVTDKKIAKTAKPMGLKNLQDWLKVFCKMQNIDYTTIKILAAEDMKVKNNENSQKQDESVNNIAVNVPEMTSETYIKTMVQTFGICVDEVNKRIYVNATLFNVQQAKYFVETFCKDVGYFELWLVSGIESAQTQIVCTHKYIEGSSWINVQAYIQQIIQFRGI